MIQERRYFVRKMSMEEKIRRPEANRTFERETENGGLYLSHRYLR
jgi:hypothetical protein